MDELRAQPRLTRRRMLTGGLALGSLALLAACGASTTPTVAPAASMPPSAAPSAAPSVALQPSVAASTAASAAPSVAPSSAPSSVPSAAPATATRAAAPATASAATATTRAVETAKGTVNVPSRPSRVVVFDRRGTLGYLLDLGIKPLAAMGSPSIYGQEFHPLLAGEVAGITAISSTEPSLEQVAGLRPDLILGFDGDGIDKVYSQLTVIAPTVMVPIDFNNPEDELRVLGRVFGLDEKANSLIQGFKEEVTKTKATIKNPGRVSIVLALADGARAYGPNNLVGQIVTGLGGTITPDVKAVGADPSGYFATLSFERLSAIDGDTIVMLANLAPELRSNNDKLLQNPLFQSLTAAKAKRIFEVETQAVFGGAGLRGQRDILTKLAKAFA